VRLFISSELIYRSKLRLNGDDGQNLQKARVRAELVKRLLILNLIIKLIYKKERFFIKLNVGFIRAFDVILVVLCLKMNSRIF
jgi:hypothetical protein